MPLILNENNIIKSTDLGLCKMFSSHKHIRVEDLLIGDIVKINFKPHREMKIHDNYLLIKKLDIKKDSFYINCLYSIDVESLINSLLKDISNIHDEGRSPRQSYRRYDKKATGDFYILKSFIRDIEIYGIVNCFGDMVYNGKKVKHHFRELDKTIEKIKLEI